MNDPRRLPREHRELDLLLTGAACAVIIAFVASLATASGGTLLAGLGLGGLAVVALFVIEGMGPD